MIGTKDLLLVLIIILVLYGKKKIPDLIKGMKEGVRNYKKALSEPNEKNVTPGRDKDKD